MKIAKSFCLLFVAFVAVVAHDVKDNQHERERSSSNVEAKQIRTKEDARTEHTGARNEVHPNAKHTRTKEDARTEHTGARNEVHPNAKHTRTKEDARTEHTGARNEVHSETKHTRTKDDARASLTPPDMLCEYDYYGECGGYICDGICVVAQPDGSTCDYNEGCYTWKCVHNVCEHSDHGDSGDACDDNEDCQYDLECASDGFCVPRACDSNFSCGSGKCVHNVCKDWDHGAADEDCDDNQDCVYPLVCAADGTCAAAKLAGAACETNSICESGKCVHNVCKDSDHGDSGDACDDLYDCSYGLECASDGTCVPSACDSNFSCGSGKCVHNVCKDWDHGAADEDCDDSEDCMYPLVCAADGTCAAAKLAGAECEVNSICESGKCVHNVCKDWDHGDSGDACDDASDCSYDMECESDGTCVPRVCDSNYSCGSGKCVHNVCKDWEHGAADEDCDDSQDCMYPLVCAADGTCAAAKLVGAACETNSICESGKCVHNVCKDWDHGDSGDACDDASDCDSWDSWNNLKCAPDGICRPQLAGADCDSNDQCYSDKCVHNVCVDWSHGEAGDKCDEDKDCEAWLGLVCGSDGTCEATPKLGIGAVCVSDVWCESDYCEIDEMQCIMSSSCEGVCQDGYHP
ncbi:unnamed protein product [Cylindrotheca closterium]|uniref:Uncharacterized protein n=1 Tax=Cylindrotheca closterium TaxID=2856 RepID=A0AAD2GBW2_9STRA|nr:unnamed protein product [Cylindrotheca closterium]